MKLLRVLYNKKAIREFKKKAQAQDEELLGWLVGGYRDGEYVIENITYPKTTGNKHWVRAEEDKPRGCIGSLHSHPGELWEFVSRDDIQEAVRSGDRIFGVFTWGLKSVPYPPPTRGAKLVVKSSLDWYSVDKLVGYTRGY